MTYPSAYTEGERAYPSETEFTVRSCGPSPVWMRKNPRDRGLLLDHGGARWDPGDGHLSPPLIHHRGAVWCDRCRFIVGAPDRMRYPRED